MWTEHIWRIRIIEVIDYFLLHLERNLRTVELDYHVYSVDLGTGDTTSSMKSYCAILGQLLVAVGVAVADPVQLTDVFQSKIGGYSCYRVPSFIASNGALHVFVEARRPSCDDQAPKDILMASSFDGGETWPARQLVVGHSFGNQTYRNPYAIALNNGSIVLQFVNSTASPWTSHQTRSDDGGLTWSEPTVQKGLPNWIDGILAGPGTGIVLGRVAGKSAPRTGRLLSCGTTGYQAGRNMTAAAWYSDDGGASWTMSEPVFPGMAECQVAELADGTVLINFRGRHENPCDCRAQASSIDGGATWSQIEWVPALVEPVCSAGLVSDVAAGCPLAQAPQQVPLIFSNPATKKSRVNMTARASYDGGKTWEWEQLLWQGPSAYSCLAALDAPWALPQPAASDGLRAGEGLRSNGAAGEGAAGGSNGCPGRVGIVFERGVQSDYEALSFAVIQPPPSSSGMWS